MLPPRPLEPPLARGAELRGAGPGRTLRIEPEFPEERITGLEDDEPLNAPLLPLKPLPREAVGLIMDEPELRLPIAEPVIPRLLGPKPELPRL